MNGYKITNLGTPTAATDAATKAYVDSLIAKVLPYRPETWPTEELEWGDVPASPAVYLQKDVRVNTGESDVPLMSWTTPAGAAYRWTVNLVSASDSGGTATITVKVDGVETDTFHLNRGATVNRNLHLPPDAAVTVTASNLHATQILIRTTNSYYQFTGVVVGPKTFDLTGEWLTLGLDMKGLEATVKIQGVEIPYSDYMKYFPIAPTELTIPGNWGNSQQRPVIKVYNI